MRRRGRAGAVHVRRLVAVLGFVLLIVVALALGVAGAAAPAGADGCGTPAAPCRVPLGEYLVALPEGADRPPALIWLHGWGGSAGAALAGPGARATPRGVALVAPQGLASGASPNRNWSVRDGRPYPRDDIAFLREVVADAAARHGIDPTRVLLAGFSRGGSLVWDVACHAPDLARGYAPVAGAFWEPMPGSCAGPANLMHVHGWTDRTVPLEGRPLGGGALVQGDVWRSLALLRAANGCAGRQPEAAGTGALWERHWTDCAGARLDLVLHAGGHVVPDWWADRALDWFAALPGVCPASEGGEPGAGC